LTESSPSTLATLLSPRLILGASAWLLVSWALNLAIDGPIRMSSETMLPAVRWLLLSAILGLHLVWPAWRLTQGTPDRPLAQTWLDMLSLALVFQIVIWPLRLLVHWSVWQTTLINLAVCVWLLPIGLCIYLGVRTPAPLMRISVQLIVLALLIAGPIYAMAAGDSASFSLNPLSIVWGMASEIRPAGLARYVGSITTIALVSLIAWIIALIVRPRAGVDARADFRNN